MSALGRCVATTAHVGVTGVGVVVHVQREKTTAANPSPRSEREKPIAREGSKPKTSRETPIK
jgi:hypothetical protein